MRAASLAAAKSIANRLPKSDSKPVNFCSKAPSGLCLGAGTGEHDAMTNTVIIIMHSFCIFLCVKEREKWEKKRVGETNPKDLMISIMLSIFSLSFTFLYIDYLTFVLTFEFKERFSTLRVSMKCVFKILLLSLVLLCIKINMLWFSHSNIVHYRWNFT